MTTAPARPSLVLRVGVTGSRTVLPGHETRVCEQIDTVLRLVRQEVARLASTPHAAQAYHGIAGEQVVASFHFLSPLAEGADRLAARIAHARGYALSVPMPFHRAEYEWDFKTGESLDEFRMMLGWAGANTLELDGGRNDTARDRYDEGRSYEAVGRFVVRNCDLLIAVWSGRPGRGRGGTADIVQFAADFGPPVWWIHAERDVPPVWINDPSDLRDAAPRADQADRSLLAYLAQLVPPPGFTPEPANSLIDAIAHIGQKHAPPLATFLAETPLPRRWWTGVHIRPPRIATTSHVRAADPVDTFWHNAFDPPDKRAGEYAARYRSTYVWMFCLGALALSCAAVALAAPELAQAWHCLTVDDWRRVRIGATAAELVALLLILWLVIVNIRREWHLRSIDYRLLAELCRKQQALARVGWSLSGRAVQALAEQHEDGTPPERAAWLIWLFAAMSRAAPMPRGIFDEKRCGRAREDILRGLVEEQISYHLGRWQWYEGAAHGFVVAGTLLFLTVIVVVAVKLALLGFGDRSELGTPLGLAATVLPALSAAAIGVRAYAELELQAEQSRWMESAMERARQRIARLDPTRPLASQELGVEVLDVATRMLQDVDGWARLFRVKLVEAG